MRGEVYGIMGRRKKEGKQEVSVKPKKLGIKDSIASINEDDIRRNVVLKMVDPDGNSKELRYSWDELLVVMLSLIVYVKHIDLTAGLIEMKATTPNMVITTMVPPDTTGGKYSTYYKIPNTQYYVCNKMNETEYLWMLRTLCKGLKLNQKKCRLLLSDRSFEMSL